MRAAPILLLLALDHVFGEKLIVKRSEDGDVVHLRSRRQPSHDITCANGNVTSAQRQLFLALHNDMRQAIARGLEGGINGVLPAARNMYKLKWSCDLETQAQTWASSCSKLEADQIEDQAQNFIYVPNVAAGEDPTQQIVNSLFGWRSQIQSAAIEEDLSFNDALDIAEWANMAHDANTQVGCAYSYCSGSLVLTCFYDKAGDVEDQLVYRIGTPCTADYECATYSASHCIPAASLCYHDEEEDLRSSNDICPKNARMTDAARVSVLDYHNALRSSAAKGLEPNGLGGMAPSASNMIKLQYDCALERSAIEAVEQCEFEDSKPRGENLFITTATNSDNDQIALLQKAAHSWWSELRLFGINTNNTFSPQYLLHNQNKYTQMAWGYTERLGCATKVCGTKFMVACHYSPAGNRFRKTIYDQGMPCTNDISCDMGQTCDVENALCAIETD